MPFRSPEKKDIFRNPFVAYGDKGRFRVQGNRYGSRVGKSTVSECVLIRSSKNDNLLSFC